MRDASRNLGLAVAALLVASVLTAAPEQGPKDNIVRQLQAAYVPTVMDATGIKVAQPGTILVVKREGIQANPPKMGYYDNDYEDGQVTAGTMSGATDKAKDKLGSITGGVGSWVKKRARGDSVALAVDDKVYLLKLDIKPASINLYVQTCGSCEPAAADPAHHPHLAKVSVHLLKGFQSTSNFSQVQQVISGILALPEANAGADQNWQAPAQPQQQEASPLSTAPTADSSPSQSQFAPIAPPAEPVRLGDTIEQVVAKLGDPVKMADLGTKKIYVYRNLKVTFVEGKITDVE